MTSGKSSKYGKMDVPWTSFHGVERIPSVHYVRYLETGPVTEGGIYRGARYKSKLKYNEPFTR